MADGVLCVCTAAIQHDTVSERLRRWTRNPLGSARRGSNPLAVELSHICNLACGCNASCLPHYHSLLCPVLLCSALCCSVLLLLLALCCPVLLCAALLCPACALLCPVLPFAALPCLALVCSALALVCSALPCNARIYPLAKKRALQLVPKQATATSTVCCCQQPEDSVSERLRRWTRNPLGSARRGFESPRCRLLNIMRNY